MATIYGTYTITDVEDGYSIILTNDNYTFAGDTTSAIVSDGNTGFNVAECSVITYVGNDQVPCTIGTITGIPTGMTVTISNNNSVNAKFTATVTSQMTTQNGILTIPVTITNNGVSKLFNMMFSYGLKLNGLDVTNLGLKINASTLTDIMNGMGVYYGYDEVTKMPSIANNVTAWVLWNGEQVTIPKGCFINPSSTMPTNQNIYSVFRLNDASNVSLGGVFHDVTSTYDSLTKTYSWESNTYSGSTATADSGAWTWDEAKDIILAMYVMPSSGAITNVQLFTPPKKYSELVEVAKGMANDAAKTATNYMVNVNSGTDGVYIHKEGGAIDPTNSEANGVLITNKVDIIRGGASVAEYGNNTRIGKENTGHMVIGNSDAKLYGYGNKLAVAFGSSNNPSTGLANVEEKILVNAWSDDNNNIYNGGYATNNISSIISCYKNGTTSISVNVLDGTNLVYNNSSLSDGDFIILRYRTTDQISYLRLGQNASASGANSVAIGENYAQGANSIAVGEMNKTLMQNTAAFGYNNTCGGTNTICNGFGNSAIGENAAVLGGINNTASGDSSAILGGIGNIASGAYSCAIGGGSTASGSHSFASGLDTTASGAQSVAFGAETIASNDASVAIGYGTVSSGVGSLTCGYHNQPNSSVLFAVGNGDTSSKSDAFWVGDGGNVGIQGRVFSGGPNASGRYPLFATGSASGTVTVPHGSTAAVTFSVAKTGYTPWALRGYDSSSASCNVYRCYLTGDNVYARFYNGSSSDISVTITAYVAYVATEAL